MSFANERIKKQIQRKVSDMLLRDLNDPRLGLVTISRVELTGDRSECKVFWSTLEEGGSRSAITHALESARGYIQREVASILHLRTSPRLEFSFDPALEGIERLSRLLNEARAEDDERAMERGDEQEEEDVPPPTGS